MKLLDGHDIINLFKLSAGPQVGRLLETVREARATGEISTRQEAIDLVKKMLDEENNNNTGEETKGEA
jgi:hypothetical protein